MQYKFFIIWLLIIPIPVLIISKKHKPEVLDLTGYQAGIRKRG